MVLICSPHDHRHVVKDRWLYGYQNVCLGKLQIFELSRVPGELRVPRKMLKMGKIASSSETLLVYTSRPDSSVSLDSLV